MGAGSSPATGSARSAGSSCGGASTTSPRTISTPTWREASDTGSRSDKQLGDLEARERLALEQRLCEPVELDAVLGDHPCSPDQGALGDLAQLAVAQLLGLLRQRIVVGPHLERAGGRAHAPVKHHHARDRRGVVEVGGRAVGDPPEHHLLGRAAAQADLEPILEFVLGGEVSILLGQPHHHAQRPAAGEDGDLVDLLAGEVGDQRMTGLVVGDHTLLLLGDQLALFEAGDDPLQRVAEVGVGRAGRGPARPAEMAASLQMFARSAPVSPAVWREQLLQAHVGASGLLRVCTARISSRLIRSAG